MTLGVWQRAGMVATLLWLAVGTYLLYDKEVSEWSARTSISYDFCMKSATAGMDWSVNSKLVERCGKEMSASFDRMGEANLLEYSFYEAGGLAVIAWVLFGIGYVAFRWIIAGRRSHTPQL